MAGGKITLYVDLISPFGYMGYYFLRHSPLFASTQITYVPILLGGLMKACNNTPPLQIRNKDRWIDLERLRWASQFHIPMSKSFPAGFPRSTVQVQRFLTSLWMEDKSADQSQFVRVLDKLYDALWTEPCESGVVDPEVFARIAAEVVSEEVVQKHLGRVADPEVKKQLIRNTDRALEDGAFGLPWFLCENGKGEVQGFWGFDHLGQVARFMGLEAEGREQGVRALL